MVTSLYLIIDKYHLISHVDVGIKDLVTCIIYIYVINSGSVPYVSKMYHTSTNFAFKL